MFISRLCRKLDSEIVDWKENTVFLLDNAKYHVSEDSMIFFQKLGVQVMLSGPYSYSKSPWYLFTSLSYSHCTNWAALWELQDWHPLRERPALWQKVSAFIPITDSLRNLVELTELVAIKLHQIPIERRIRFWHKTSLHLFQYLSFNRLWCCFLL